MRTEGREKSWNGVGERWEAGQKKGKWQGAEFEGRKVGEGRREYREKHNFRKDEAEVAWERGKNVRAGGVLE